MSEASRLLYCSFCGRSQLEVLKLIAGPKVFICEKCTDKCIGIILEEKTIEEKAFGEFGMTNLESLIRKVQDNNK